MEQKIVNGFNLYASYADAPEAVRNALTKQFEPLINKLTGQFAQKIKTDWFTIKSMAYEGFVIAMNTYDPVRATKEAQARAGQTGKAKKPMDFAQFAAFAMLNNIRTSLDNELRTVKMSNYMQQQVKDAGGSTFTSISMTTITGERSTGSDEGGVSREGHYGLVTPADFAEDNRAEHLYAAIDEHFNEMDRYVFYSVFGLHGYEEKKAVEIAQEQNVTCGRISQRLKKVINWIKQDEELCEIVAAMAGIE